MTTSPEFIRAVVLDSEGDVVRDGLRLLRREARDAVYGFDHDSSVVKIYAVLATRDDEGYLVAPEMVEVVQRHIETSPPNEQDYYGVRYGLFRPEGTEPVATFGFHVDGRV